MRIAFVGDIHGRALHALGAVVGWQAHSGHGLAGAIQVGDFGAFTRESFPHSDWYAVHNPSERDALRVLEPDGRVAEGIRLALDALPGPVRFIGGNHEDFDWLDGLHRAVGRETVALDPLGAFEHVADGAVVELAGERVGFLGGIDAPGRRFDFDAAALKRLEALGPGRVDILVTHDNPVGVPSGFAGRGGSKRISALIERLQPWLHVGGHIHQMHGPRRYGRTTSYTLSLLVPSKRDRWSGAAVNPEQRVDAGSVAIADTDARTFQYIVDEWLGEIAGDDFDLAGYVRRVGRATR